MCNTKNTDLIRQQLWCDIITSSNGEVPFDKILVEADKLVAEFDKRFSEKIIRGTDFPIDEKIVVNLDKFRKVATSLHTTTEEVAQNLERIKKEKPSRDSTTYIERDPNPKAYSVQELGIIDWDAIYRPKKFTFASLINSLLKLATINTYKQNSNLK